MIGELEGTGTIEFTGEQFRAPSEIGRLPVWDRVHPAHDWILCLAYRVDPHLRNTAQHLGPNNLLETVGPFCYHCDAPGDDENIHTVCPGPPPEMDSTDGESS